MRVLNELIERNPLIPGQLVRRLDLRLIRAVNIRYNPMAYLLISFRRIGLHAGLERSIRVFVLFLSIDLYPGEKRDMPS